MTENGNGIIEEGAEKDGQAAGLGGRIVRAYRVAYRFVLRFLRNTIFQADFGIAATVGVGVGFWAYYKHSVQLDEGVVLTTDIGAAVGLLAVTLAAMTLILGFLQGFYANLIRVVPGGVKSFFYPFKVIAVVAGGAAVSGIVSALDADSSPLRLSSILFGFSVGLLTWAIIGSVQLVFIFVGHGTLWLELDEALSRRSPRKKIPEGVGDADAPGKTGDPGAGSRLSLSLTASGFFRRKEATSSSTARDRHEHQEGPRDAGHHWAEPSLPHPHRGPGGVRQRGPGPLLVRGLGRARGS
jgi:hypothetical protein